MCYIQDDHFITNKKQYRVQNISDWILGSHKKKKKMILGAREKHG